MTSTKDNFICLSDLRSLRTNIQATIKVESNFEWISRKRNI